MSFLSLNSLYNAIYILGALLVLLIIFCVLWMLFVERPERAAKHASPREHRPTFHPAETAALSLPGRGRQERAGTGAAPVPVPAGQPSAAVQRYAALAWQTAGTTEATFRRMGYWPMHDNTGWDKCLAAELRDRLARDDARAWVNKAYARIVTDAPKALALPAGLS